MLVQGLIAATGCTTLIKNGSARARLAEGLPEVSGVLVGTAPEAPIVVPMSGATYMADVMGGQKTGLFFDQRDNHAFAARLAQGARVLDVFSHVGGFALACLAAGASGAVAVDGSEPALTLARAGAAAMGVEDRLATRQGDAFAQMEAAGRRGRAVRSGDLRPAGLCAIEERAGTGPARLRTGGAAGRGPGRAGRRADLVFVLPTPPIWASSAPPACAASGGPGGDPRLIHTGFAGPDHPPAPGADRNRLPQGGGVSAAAMRAVIDACVL